MMTGVIVEDERGSYSLQTPSLQLKQHYLYPPGYSLRPVYTCRALWLQTAGGMGTDTAFLLMNVQERQFDVELRRTVKGCKRDENTAGDAAVTLMVTGGTH